MCVMIKLEIIIRNSKKFCTFAASLINIKRISMKKSILWTVFVVLFFSYSYTNAQAQRECIPSNGEMWSSLLQRCVKFEEGVRLDPIDSEQREVFFSLAAFFNADKSKMEVFAEGAPLIMDKKEGNTYQNGKYSYNADKQEFFVDGKLTFRGVKK